MPVDFSNNKHYKIAERVAEKFFHVKPEEFKEKVINRLDKVSKEKQLYSKELKR